VALALFALGAASCCPRPWPKDLAPIPDAGLVLRGLEHARAPLKSISATAKIDAFTREGRARVREVLVAERGGRLRFETLSPFEQPMATMVSDGKRFALYDLGKKHFYHGPATPQNVARILPIRLQGSDVARLLLGDPPLIVHEAATLVIERCHSRYRLTLTNQAAGLRQDLAVDAARLLPVESRIYLGGELLYAVQFEDYAEIEKLWVPRKLLYRSPADKVDILVLYGDVGLNEALEDDLFRLQPPRGVTVTEVE
jgi:outer membrane lipoprotein-sorting protein